MLKNLIRLDFYTMKPLAKMMFAFLIIPFILGFVTSPGMSIIVTLTFVVFMLNTVFSISEKSNFNALYGVLPIQRSQSILSRYLFSLLVLAFATIISFLMYILISLFLDGSVSLLIGLEFACIAIVISLFFISIQYPFYFKFDYSKATIMSILPYVICFAIGSPLLNVLMKDITFYTTVMSVINYFQANPIILFASAFLICVSLISTSYLISIKVQKKEF